ncbi:FlaD/FlaE family flagellar protein [Halobellus ruber]|uniref:Flagellar protein d/e n=1 Tax=Halobellus ruber TaxID=2761102 RepID=A0A7J9SL83_9EURY|nr:FlaD/FlaE family flagellar protein [Halobellus ruber]MBB6647710.1 flagellar protein d/e [Halobellus ruber]
MTIDPDDYDLRELRRIADERREARRSDDTNEERRHRFGARRGRRSDGARRNGGDRRRDGESAERPAEGRRERQGADGPAADEVTVRPRDGAEPSQPAEDRDEVVRADRIARDVGFGNGDDERRRDERATRSRERRRRRDAGGRPDADDDVGRFQFDTEPRERPRSRPGRALRGNQLEQLLVHETAASEGVSKPYLTSLPDAYAAERLLFDWLEFLVLKGGYKRTMDALRYYRAVEWLTAEVEAELRDYLVGFSGEVSDTDAYDVDDHHLSLVYIARLSSMT